MIRSQFQRLFKSAFPRLAYDPKVDFYRFMRYGPWFNEVKVGRWLWLFLLILAYDLYWGDRWWWFYRWVPLVPYLNHLLQEGAPWLFLGADYLLQLLGPLVQLSRELNQSVVEWFGVAEDGWLWYPTHEYIHPFVRKGVEHRFQEKLYRLHPRSIKVWDHGWRYSWQWVIPLLLSWMIYREHWVWKLSLIWPDYDYGEEFDDYYTDPYHFTFPYGYSNHPLYLEYQYYPVYLYYSMVYRYWERREKGLDVNYQHLYPGEELLWLRSDWQEFNSYYMEWYPLQLTFGWVVWLLIRLPLALLVLLALPFLIPPIFLYVSVVRPILQVTVFQVWWFICWLLSFPLNPFLRRAHPALVRYFRDLRWIRKDFFRTFLNRWVDAYLLWEARERFILSTVAWTVEQEFITQANWYQRQRVYMRLLYHLNSNSRIFVHACNLGWSLTFRPVIYLVSKAYRHFDRKFINPPMVWKFRFDPKLQRRVIYRYKPPSLKDYNPSVAWDRMVEVLTYWFDTQIRFSGWPGWDSLLLGRGWAKRREEEAPPPPPPPPPPTERVVKPQPVKRRRVRYRPPPPISEQMLFLQLEREWEDRAVRKRIRKQRREVYALGVKWFLYGVFIYPIYDRRILRFKFLYRPLLDLVFVPARRTYIWACHRWHLFQYRFRRTTLPRLEDRWLEVVDWWSRVVDRWLKVVDWWSGWVRFLWDRLLRPLFILLLFTIPTLLYQLFRFLFSLPRLAPVWVRGASKLLYRQLSYNLVLLAYRLFYLLEGWFWTLAARLLRLLPRWFSTFLLFEWTRFRSRILKWKPPLWKEVYHRFIEGLSWIYDLCIGWWVTRVRRLHSMRTRFRVVFLLLSILLLISPWGLRFLTTFDYHYDLSHMVWIAPIVFWSLRLSERFQKWAWWDFRDLNMLFNMGLVGYVLGSHCWPYTWERLFYLKLIVLGAQWIWATIVVPLILLYTSLFFPLMIVVERWIDGLVGLTAIAVAPLYLVFILLVQLMLDLLPTPLWLFGEWYLGWVVAIARPVGWFLFISSYLLFRLVAWLYSLIDYSTWTWFRLNWYGVVQAFFGVPLILLFWFLQYLVGLLVQTEFYSEVLEPLGRLFWFFVDKTIDPSEPKMWWFIG